ncbi:hypothetical protein MMC10_010576 [Thelotrema lepadinum]|nr:hypothetical protein [Thelotrema lepadinum]
MKYKLFHPYLVALIFAAGHLASPVSTHLDRERYEHLVNRAPPRESEHPGPPREWWMQIVDANTKRIQVLEAEYKKNTKRMKEAHVPSVATEWRRALQFNEREREFFKAENDRIKTCALRSPSDTIMSLTASIVLFHDRIHFVEDQRLMQQTDVSDRSSGNDYWRKAPKNHAKDIEEAKSLIQNAQILSASNPPNTIDSSPSHRSASEKQPLLQGHVDSSSHVSKPYFSLENYC